MNLETKTDAANLTLLAEESNTAHRAVADSMRDAVTHALRAGEALEKAKAALPHGRFSSWLQENIGFSDRTARAYMQAWSNRDVIEAKRQHVADLSVRKALKLLAKPRPVEPDLPLLPDLLAVEPRAWIELREGGFRCLTPSAAHPGYAFVDEVNHAEGWADVARRPIKFEGLDLFYPDTVWRSPKDVAEVIKVVLPERVPDLIAFGLLHEEVRAAA